MRAAAEGEDLLVVVVDEPAAGATSAGERRPCIHAPNQKSAFAPTGRHARCPGLYTSFGRTRDDRLPGRSAGRQLACRIRFPSG